MEQIQTILTCTNRFISFAEKAKSLFHDSETLTSELNSHTTTKKRKNEIVERLNFIKSSLNALKVEQVRLTEVLSDLLEVQPPESSSIWDEIKK